MAAGGLPALQALSAVFGEVRFCPTGGITQDNAAAWLGLPAVACVGGSWLAPAGEAVDRKAIKARAKAAAALRRRLKIALSSNSRLLMTPVSVSTKRKSGRACCPSSKTAAGLPADSSPRAAPRRGSTTIRAISPTTLDEAYAIQDEAIARWGRPVIGWKVGRVPPPLIDRFGTDRLAGPIFAQQPARGNGAALEMPVFAEGFAAGEAEFLLEDRHRAAARQGRFQPGRSRRADRRRPCRHRGRQLAARPRSTSSARSP